MDSTGSGTSAPPCASVRSCRSTTPATSLGHRATKDTPQATVGRGPQTSQSLCGRRHAVTPRSAHGGTTRDGFPLWHIQKPPATVCPAEWARAVLTPRGCKAARRNNAKRQRTLAYPVAAAARRFRRHGESSSMRVWTGTMGAPATSTPSGHHLPLIPDAGRRGFAPNRRTFDHSHASPAGATGSASRGPPPGGGRSIKLIRRLPPRVSGQPAVRGITRHGHTAKGACGRPKACARNGGTAPPTAPKLRRHGGHIATTGAGRERPKGGHRNDGDLQPSGVC